MAFIWGVAGVVAVVVVVCEFFDRRGVMKVPRRKYPQAGMFRRARDSEVTPEMVAAAKAALSSPLGTIIEHDGFAILVETHSDERRGEHKGASVFVPE